MSFLSILAWLHWDPNRFAFTMPIINRPVAWYGICFAFGFILGFYIIIPIFKRKLQQTNKILERDIANWPILITHLKKAANQKNISSGSSHFKIGKKLQASLEALRFKQEPNDLLKKEILEALNASFHESKTHYTREKLEVLFPKAIHKLRDLALLLTDRITWFVMAGTIIGARLGHILFYEWPRYKNHPVDMIKIWEGGLASHGAVIGIMLALYLYLRMIRKRFPELTFINILDIICIPAAIAAVWIRIGNFFNQEIIGPITSVPWAVVFGHPIDGGGPLPRHPTQLYEAVVYLLTFFFLFFLWKKKGNILKPGTITGLFLILVFGSRFCIEFVKNPSSLMIDESFLQTGQYLSIPLILLGFSLLFYDRLSGLLFKQLKQKNIRSKPH